MNTQKHSDIITVVIIIASIISLIIVSALFITSTTGHKIMVKIGDKELAKGNIEKALEYYYLAEEEGTEKAKEIHNEITNDYIEAFNYQRAVQYLETETREYWTSEEIENFVLNSLWSNIRNENLQLNKNSLLNLAEIANKYIGQDKNEEIKDAIYYKIGWICFDKGQYKEMIDAFKKCKNNEGKDISQNIQKLEKGEYTAGVQQLLDQFGDKAAVKKIFNIIVATPKYETVSKYIDYCYASSILQRENEEANEIDLSEPYERLSQIVIGANRTISTRKTENNHIGPRFDESELENLKEKTGKDPQGKILFLYQSVTRTGTKQGIFIAKELMECLPAQYTPENMESVEYIIYIEATMKQTGARYTCGTKQCREDVTITMYYVPSGYKTWSHYVMGPTSYSMSYSGSPPEYYSEGGPDVKEAILNALNRIEQGYK